MSVMETGEELEVGFPGRGGRGGSESESRSVVSDSLRPHGL